jgi:hypothetical protein
MQLAKTCRVAVIAGPGDFAALAAAAGTVRSRQQGLAGPVELDWDSVPRVADAVWLTADGLVSLGGWGEPFYWWDAETIAVLRASALGQAADVLVRTSSERAVYRAAQVRAGHGFEPVVRAPQHEAELEL